jgi:hypothetical protein
LIISSYHCRAGILHGFVRCSGADFLNVRAMLAQLPLILGFAGYFAFNLVPVVSSYQSRIPVCRDSSAWRAFFGFFVWHVLRTTPGNGT